MTNRYGATFRVDPDPNLFSTSVPPVSGTEAYLGTHIALRTLDLSSVAAPGSTGIPIVSSLPALPDATNFPQGYVVFLTTDNKLYRSTGPTWTTVVDSGDLAANSVTTNAILAGAVTAAKISVTQLSAIAANLGTITAGLARDTNSKFTVDFNNALITVVDNQGAPVTRLKLGKVGAATTDYGLQIWNSAGTLLYDLTGLAANTVDTTQLVNNAVTSGKILDNAVITSKINALAVDASKLASGAVDLTKFASGLRPVEIVSSLPAAGTQGRTVFLTTDNKLYRDTGAAWVATVPTTDLTGTIATAQLANLAVTAAKLADLSVDQGKLTAAMLNGLSFVDARNRVPNAGFEDDMAYWQPGTGVSVVNNSANAKSGNKYMEITSTVSIDVNLVQDNQATLRYFELPPGAVIKYGCWAQVVSGSGLASINAITADKDKANRVGHSVSTSTAGWQLLTGTFTPSSTDKYQGLKLTCVVNSGTVTVRFDDVFVYVLMPGTDIVANSITASQIAAATITANEIAALTILAGNIAAGAITTTKIAAGAVTANEIAALTILAGNIAAGAITTAKIAAGAVTANEIAADTITAGQIAAGAITASELAANAVTATAINAGAVIAGKIAAHAVAFNEMFVGSFDNLVLDPGFEQASSYAGAGVSGWTLAAQGGGTFGFATTNMRSGARCGQFNPSGQTTSSAITANFLLASASGHVAVTEGDKLYFEIWARKVGAGTPSNIRVALYFRDAAGVNVSFTNGGTLTPTTTYQQATVTATAPANSVFVVFVVEMLPVGGATELVNFDDAYARRMVTGSIIVDGTITATKIAALTITANEIAAATITAAKLSISQLSAIAADMGTLTAGTVRDTNSKFVIDLANVLLSVVDNQGSPVTRVKIGKVGAGTTDYGIQIFDSAGATIADFTGAKRVLAVPIQASTDSGTSLTVDLSTGLTQQVRLTGTATLNLTNPVNGGRYRLWLQQDTVGSRPFPTITVAGSDIVMYTNDTKPTLTTEVGALDLFELEYRSSPTPRATCMPLQTNVKVPAPTMPAAAAAAGGHSTATTSHATSFSAATSGQLLLLIMALRKLSAGAPSITAPSGWTTVGTANTDNTVPDSNTALAVFVKVSDGTETAATVTTNVNTLDAWMLYRISRHGGTANVVVGFATSTSTTTPDPPSLTPGWTDDRNLWIAAFGLGLSIPALNAPTAPTNYTNFVWQDDADPGGSMSVGVARRTLYAATENPGTFSTSVAATNAVAATIAIRPPV